MQYAILSILGFAMQSIGNKEYGRRFPPSMIGLALYNALALSVTALGFALLGGARLTAPALLAFAVPFGLIFVATIALLVTSFATGPMALTTLVLNAGSVIPLLFGVLVYGERFTWFSGLGVGCMALVLALSSGGGSGAKPVTARWLMTAVAASVLNGSLSLLQKGFQATCAGATVAEFSFWGFLSAALGAWVLFGALCARGQSFAAYKKPALPLCAVLMGSGTAIGNGLIMTALYYVDSAIVFPSVLGGIVIFVWLASLILYREPFTKRGFAALIAGVAGLILISV